MSVGLRVQVCLLIGRDAEVLVVRPRQECDDASLCSTFCSARYDSEGSHIELVMEHTIQYLPPPPSSPSCVVGGIMCRRRERLNVD